MKTYNQFIQESSLTRVASKTDKGGVGTCQLNVLTNLRKKTKLALNN